MKYKKIEHDGYTLHIINTNKFKNNMIKVNYTNKCNGIDLLKRKLISKILSRSNTKYPSLRLINVKTEELYNLNVFGGTTRNGESAITSLNASFLNDRYAKNLFNDACEFLSDIIFKPIVVNGKFDDKVFKQAKELLKEELDEMLEDSNAYATQKAISKLLSNTPLEYPISGTKEDIDKLKNKDVYAYYVNMLKTDHVDIYVIGNIENVDNIVSKYFKVKGAREKSSYMIRHDKFTNKYNTYKETKDYQQSVLIFGYKLDKLTSFERLYVMPIYSYILGGGPDSKLFMNVREKNSLCYSISSSFKNVSNIMLIKAFINKDNYNKTVKLVKKEVEDLNNGNFTKEDISKAKITFLSAYDEAGDTIYDVLADYVSRDSYGTHLVSTRKKMIKKVSKKDILNVSKKIHPEIIYFLEGDDKDAKEKTK